MKKNNKFKIHPFGMATFKKYLSLNITFCCFSLYDNDHSSDEKWVLSHWTRDEHRLPNKKLNFSVSSSFFFLSSSSSLSFSIFILPSLSLSQSFYPISRRRIFSVVWLTFIIKWIQQYLDKTHSIFAVKGVW